MFHTAVGPAADLAVAGEPLLLRVRTDRAIDPRVGDVAAAGPAVPVRGQVQVAVHVHPAERGGLRHRPPVDSRPTGRSEKFSADRQKFCVALPPNQPASTVTSPLMCDVVRVLAETGDRGVKADVGVERCTCPA